MSKKTKKTKDSFLKKSKVKLPKYDPTKVLLKGQHSGLVKEGRTGHFSEEYEKEMKWLS